MKASSLPGITKYGSLGEAMADVSKNLAKQHAEVSKKVSKTKAAASTPEGK